MGVLVPHTTTSLSPAYFGLVEAKHHSRNNMAAIGVEIIAWAIQVSEHDGSVVHAILAAITLAQFNPGNFGHGVRLVGGLKRTLHQLGFCYGLRS